MLYLETPLNESFDQNWGFHLGNEEPAQQLRLLFLRTWLESWMNQWFYREDRAAALPAAGGSKVESIFHFNRLFSIIRKEKEADAKRIADLESEVAGLEKKLDEVTESFNV
ncbi:hypothetical protein ACJX0J_030925, partial [Zea mays]